MLLKRLYDMSEPEKPKVNGVRVLSLGASPAQHFTPELIAQAQAQGWMDRAGDKLILKGENKTVEYRALRGPGYYCCHCKAPMPDGAVARAHIAEKHAGKKSPDPANPSGYERIHYFDCVKEVNT